MKKVFLLLFVSALSISIGACNSKKENKEIKLENCSIHRDDEFGGAYIDISITDFNNLGYNLYKINHSVLFCWGHFYNNSIEETLSRIKRL